jgi:hypothetical protein
MLRELTPEQQAEFTKRFGKIFRHEERDRIIEMLEAGVAGEKVATWTYDLSKEHGVPPGTKSPFSISIPTMCWFARWWRDLGRASGKEVEKPREAVESKYKSDVLLMTAEQKKRQATQLLDEVIDKALHTLQSQEKVSVQTAMQAIQLRQSLDSQQDSVVEFSVEVRTVLAQIVQIVNEECPNEIRIRIAERLERLPTFKKTMLSETASLPSGETAIEAEFKVEAE